MQYPSSESKLTVDELMPLVYEELRRLASRYLLGERPGHTLRATALVHEAYLRLAGSHRELHDKSEFLALAARVMRHILVDHARAQGRQKRGGRPKKITLTESSAVDGGDWLDL